MSGANKPHRNNKNLVRCTTETETSIIYLEANKMRTLVRMNPNRELFRMNRMMDRLFDDLSGGSFEPATRDWAMPLDVVEGEEGFTIKASLPGVNSDDIDITFEDKVLTIKAEVKNEDEREENNYHIRERQFGSFGRSVRLGVDINVDNIDANYENGILTLTLPKAEAVKPKRIAIKTTVN
jgi:HSP20 family protein